MRVQRLMQKVRVPKDAKMPTAFRVPGFRVTFDKPTGQDKNEFELSLLEAQALVVYTPAKFFGRPFKKVIEIEDDALLASDELAPAEPSSDPEPSDELDTDADDVESPDEAPKE